MPRRPRASIRLWQTELFVVVIVVAILILSGSLSAGLRVTLTEMAEENELRNASALARRLEPEFPITDESLQRVRNVLAEYRGIYGGGIWVYDADGTLIESAAEEGPTERELQAARRAGLNVDVDYVRTDLRENGWVIASREVRGPLGTREGVVVTASSVNETVAILTAVRDRLWITFWVSLAIAGLLGYAFSGLISRRIRAMQDAATAIAGGDFDQRLPTGFVPDEVQELAETYNTMADRLGETFGELQESQRQIAAVVESMAEGVVAFDSAGLVRVINPEAVRLLSLEEADHTCRDVSELTSDEAVLTIVHAGLAGESSVATVALGNFMVLLHGNPLLEPDGTVDGAVLLLADVTEQYRIEDAQRRFIADASHEMRTPIAALKGMLELLEDGAKDVPEVRDDFIHTMQVEADRLGRLVADLLTLAQLEAGQLNLKIAPEFAADLLGDVARIMHTLAEQASVTLAVDVADPDIRVMADRDKIVQVLLSFTDNALKHAPAGSTVHLRAHAREGGALLEVADEGPGIEPDQVARVFERFYRADAARGGGKGAGLGLAIAKEIVEAHGSHIEVTSEPRNGTTFSFELPRP